jgi:hypothetical protein
VKRLDVTGHHVPHQAWVHRLGDGRDNIGGGKEGGGGREGGGGVRDPEAECRNLSEDAEPVVEGEFAAATAATVIIISAIRVFAAATADIRVDNFRWWSGFFRGGSCALHRRPRPQKLRPTEFVRRPPGFEKFFLRRSRSPGPTH